MSAATVLALALTTQRKPAHALARRAVVRANPEIQSAIQAIHSEIDRGLQDHMFSAAAFGWVQDGTPLSTAYFGEATAESIFDIASLTKPVFTSSAIALLGERGLLKSGDAASLHLPEWKECPPGRAAFCASRENIRIEDLLRHQSGLSDAGAFPGDIGFLKKVKTAVDAGQNWRSLLSGVIPAVTPQQTFMYQDINFVLLMEIARNVLKKAEPALTVESFVNRELYAPLGMNSTFAHDVPSEAKSLQIRTLQDLPVGVIHDPLARLLPQTSGNAGLFSTLNDLLRFTQMLQSGGVLNGRRFFLEETVRAFGLSKEPGKRGMGWDVASAYATAIRGKFTEGFGHTGYTGTSIWMVPSRKLTFVLLTNRTFYADGPLPREGEPQPPSRVPVPADPRFDTTVRIRELRSFVANQIFEAVAGGRP